MPHKNPQVRKAWKHAWYLAHKAEMLKKQREKRGKQPRGARTQEMRDYRKRKREKLLAINAAHDLRMANPLRVRVLTVEGSKRLDPPTYFRPHSAG